MIHLPVYKHVRRFLVSMVRLGTIFFKLLIIYYSLVYYKIRHITKTAYSQNYNINDILLFLVNNCNNFDLCTF